MRDISKLSRLFSNRLMKNGKKSLSDKFVKQILLELKLSKESPKRVLALAVLNAGPLVCVKNVKSRGKTFQVPFPLTPKQQVSKGFDQILANTSFNSGGHIIWPVGPRNGISTRVMNRNIVNLCK